MPVFRKRDNDGRQNLDWSPPSKKTHSLLVPQGGGERSKPQRIAANIAKVVQAHKDDAPSEIAEYLLNQIRINPRLNPATILVHSGLEANKLIEVARIIKQAIIDDESQDS